jgi:replicative DNA helicase
VDDLERGGGAVDLPKGSDVYADVSRLITEGPPKNLLKPGGFEPLLNMLGGAGLWPGLYVLGGPPTVGKTTFTMQLVEYALRDYPDLVVLYASVEMTAGALFRSCVCRQARINKSALLRGELAEHERAGAEKAAQAVGERLYRMRFTKEKRVSEIRRWSRRYRPGLVVIDYLQKLLPKDKYMQAKDRVDHVAAELMELRDENPEVPILVLASHNRGQGKKPYEPGRGLGAYKETGNIEYDADFAFNLEYEGQEWDRWRSGQLSDLRDLVLAICKNREGDCGRVEVDFHGPTQTFRLKDSRAYGQSTKGAEDA